MLRREKIDFFITQSKLNEGITKKEITRIEPCLDMSHIFHVLPLVHCGSKA